MKKLNINKSQLIVLEKFLSLFSLKKFKTYKNCGHDAIEADLYLKKSFLGHYFDDGLTGDINEADLNTVAGKEFSLLCAEYNLHDIYESEYSYLYENNDLTKDPTTEQDLFTWICYLLINKLLEEKAFQKQQKKAMNVLTWQDEKGGFTYIPFKGIKTFSDFKKYKNGIEQLQKVYDRESKNLVKINKKFITPAACLEEVGIKVNKVLHIS